MKKLLLSICLISIAFVCYAETITCWFPPGWKSKPAKAKAITASLTKHSGITIRPRIAKSYPQILKAFDSGQPSLVYVGSFVQAIIKARKLGTPLAQGISGKEFYSGVLIYPKGQDPKTILKSNPSKIAYAVGASSGESSAKAATGGKAAIKTSNHGASAGATKVGKAKAGVVKNWWWDANKSKFPMLAMYRIPGVSIEKNPDNVLTASNSVSVSSQKKIKKAAYASTKAFGVKKMAPFDQSKIQFSIDLMKKGNINPNTYSW